MSYRYLQLRPEVYDVLLEQLGPRAFRRHLAENAVSDAVKTWWIQHRTTNPSNNTA